MGCVYEQDVTMEAIFGVTPPPLPSPEEGEGIVADVAVHHELRISLIRVRHAIQSFRSGVSATRRSSTW